LPKFRRLFAGGALLLTTIAASPTAATFALESVQPVKVALVLVQRPISEDPQIDQQLVVSLPALMVVPEAPAPPPPPPPSTPEPVAGPANTDESETEFQIASIGPAMRPLVPQFNAMWPTSGEITTYFGEVGRYSPRGHAGVDVAAPAGTSIVAIDGGEVIKAYWNEDGYGGLIVVAHPSGYETWYGHLARFDVRTGDLVKRGEHIGLMGSTGYSTGPHLHFEVRQDGQLRDPLLFLKEANLEPADW
jgi:murein DD-endopeptidase MepM/ murein hydrolase activator NlpD